MIINNVIQTVYKFIIFIVSNIFFIIAFLEILFDMLIKLIFSAVLLR